MSAGARTTDRCASWTGSALHVMLCLENFIRALLIFNGLRSRYYQRALLGYHYQDDAIALTAELSPPLDVLNMLNMRELPSFRHPIVVTVFFKDDDNHGGRGRRCLRRDVDRDGRKERGCRSLLGSIDGH